MPEQIRFTQDQLTAYKKAYAANATDDQFTLFVAECERRSLIPGVHVVFQLRAAKEYSLEHKRYIDVQKVTLITTIHALRLIAERSGKFKGYGKFSYYYGDADGSPTIISAIPLGKVPHAVSVELFRDGWALPVFAVARYEAYVQTKQDNGKDVPTRMWRQRGEEQLAKCAEALGLRMVAPEDCGGLYIAEELKDSIEQDAPETETRQQEVVVLPIATVAPPVNQAPAQLSASPAPVQTAAPQAAPSVPPIRAVRPAPPAAKPTPAPVKVVPPATPAPAAAQPAGPVSNRQPLPEQPVQESVAELSDYADRVARDKTELQPPQESAQPAQQATPAAPAPAKIIVANAAPAPTGDDVPANAAEYKVYTDRAAKIVRDKLEKQANLKNAGAMVKDYLLKQSGKDKLNKISAAAFERIISTLEKATPEEAATLVKG
jgi:hypothetical protein